METTIQTLNDFVKLFTGNKEAYGIHLYDDDKTDKEKKAGTNWTETKPVMEKLYREHLNGGKGLGIVPITKEDTVNFCVIDIDIYKNHETTIKSIYRYGFPLLPFRSKSGGLHLYLFFDAPVSAKKAIDILKLFIPVFSLDKKTEIFPKQKTLTKDGSTGSWINLPYYNALETKQYCFDQNGKPFSLEQAVKEIKSKVTNFEKINTFMETLPVFDGPPCLQSIYIKGETEFRNNYLFSLARYYKSKYGDDFEFKLMEANTMLSKPLDTEELLKTVINTHKKKDYTYRCSTSPICDNCYSGECEKRQYGIGGTEVSELSFEEFQKHMADPPFYIWIINGKELRFYSESEIIKQVRFRELCVRELLILPCIIKEINWTKIVNTALKNVVVKEIAEDEDISPGSLFKEFLVEFLTRRSLAQTREQIIHDRVFEDTERKSYVFKSKNLLSFLIHQKQFRYFSIVEIHDRLKRMGAVPLRYYVNQNVQSIRVWEMPCRAVEKFEDRGNEENETIDFAIKENF